MRVAVAIGVLAIPALAHDLWLVPPDCGARVGEPVEVVVAVGMDFPASLHALDPERFSASAVGPASARAEVALRKAEEEQRTLAAFTPTAPGAWLVAGSTRPNRLEMEAAEFNEYLLHDGLPQVLSERMERGELDRPAVERYQKHVKALVAVGGSSAGEAFRAVLGQELEIVPLQDPLAAAVGQLLPVQVLFRGAPLEHANLCWDHPANGEDFAGQTWTDAEGRALVHMTRPRMAEHEWESFWASLTFRVRAE
jgi:uncharacterized GH25 family protein